MENTRQNPKNMDKSWFQHVSIVTFPTHCFFGADPQDGRLGRGLEVLQRGACPELVAVPGFQVPAEDQVISSPKRRHAIPGLVNYTKKMRFNGDYRGLINKNQGC